MSKAVSQPYEEYEAILKKGKAFMESELYDGEYFIQKVMWEGLRAPSPVEAAKTSLMTIFEFDLMKKRSEIQYGKTLLTGWVCGSPQHGLPEVLDNQR
jgi:hypothetical protein